MHLELTAMPEPETLDDMRAEIMLLRASIEAMRRELVLQRLTGAPAAPPPQPSRRARRDELLRQLAAGIGLGATKAGAVAVLLTITGTRPPPEGMAAVLDELRDCGPLPTCWESIYRAVTR